MRVRRLSTRRRGPRNGRPLRFLALTLGGWATTRVVLLWPIIAILPAARSVISRSASPIAAQTAPRVALAAPTGRAALAPSRARQEQPERPPQRDTAARSLPSYGSAPAPEDRALASGALVPPDRVAASSALPSPSHPSSRLAGSAWAIARGGGNGTLLGGQLGASQAGVRLTYALGEARRIALSARIASPLRGSGKEAAFGFDWRPTRLPLHLLAEQRVSLDGQRGGPSLTVIGGIDPTPIVAGFRLEAYGQAGAIKRDAVEAFGDGAARLTAPIATVGPVRLDLGAGGWGAAQRGVRRLDVGPTFGAVLPVAGKALRVTVDWRERVAGNARPGSGPAVSLGTDF